MRSVQAKNRTRLIEPVTYAQYLILYDMLLT